MSTVKNIRQKISKMKAGKIFFLSDFQGENYGALRTCLSRMSESGEIVRLAHGIYQKALYDKKFGLGLIKASNEEIARAYAKKIGINLYHTSEAAQNIIGLSTQNQLKTMYYTNGRSRTIRNEDGTSIVLTHYENHRISDFRTKEMQTVMLALKNLTENDIDNRTRNIIYKYIEGVSESDFNHDVKYLKRWQQRILNNQR